MMKITRPRYSPLFARALCSSISSSAHAAGNVYIPVGSAKTKKSVVAFAPILARGDTAVPLAKALNETVSNDLTFMDLFRFLPPAAFVEPSGSRIAPNTFKMCDWTSIGAEFLIKTAVEHRRRQT